ncbi:MAG TPA: two-component regulator propeller domain-containing protein, partial [Thermoanaerobaculia bacterium]|nr:two-component regulator propeller domain-containing protein [Thermoanaerobaculia bacterium]
MTVDRHRVWSLAALFFLFSSALLAASAAGDADAPQYTFDIWDASHGLPQSSVQAVTQSRAGYIWIGTMGGLARFDGLRFTVFDKRNTPLLQDNVIQSLLCDGDRLWIGTGAGGVATFENGRFRRVPGFSSDVVWDLEPGAKGAIWAATQKGIAVIDGRRIRRIAIPGAPPSEPFLTVIRDRHGVMWAGSESGLLARIDGDAIRTWGPTDGLPSAPIRALVEGPDGSIWIGSDSGLAMFDGRTVRTFTTEDGLPSDVIRALTIDHEGTLWVGTYGGLCRLAGDRFVAFTRENSALPSDAIRTILDDREGNLWVGTGGGGLVRLKEASVRSITNVGGVPVKIARAVMEARDGSLWIGTLGEGAIRIRGGSATTIDTRAGLPDDVVYALAEDPSGAMWIGTRRGIARWSAGSVRLFGTADGLGTAPIRSLFIDRDGVVWAGTASGAFRLNNGRFEPAGDTAGRAVFFITQTRDGAIWMAVYGDSLQRLHRGQTEIFRESDGLPTAAIWSIHEDQRGTLWIGSRGAGLIRFQDGRFRSFDTTDGLPDDVIYHVLEDEEGRLWMSANKGIFAARRTELDAFADGKSTRISSLSLGKAEGMVSSECNGASQPAGWKAADGKLYFPTLAGVAVVDPATIAAVDVMPRAIIERLVVNGESIETSDGLSIPPGADRLEIHYTGLMLSAPAERIIFRYRLSPLESEWIEGGVDRSARYTNLPPGRYRFQVAAAERGSHLASEASLPFAIEPHLWETALFWLAIGALAVAAVALAAWWRGGRARRREKELLQLVSQRTEQLAAANALLEQQSRVDSLTGLANRRHFDETLDREWRRAIRDRAWISLILADVDQFKAFNDAYGHQSGDECLRRIAGILRESAHRPGDLVARYGGEEFAIIL